MLSLSLALCLAAALVGGVLAALHLRPDAAMPSRWFGAVHAAVATGGLLTLLTALRGPVRGAAMGVGSFGVIAAVLLAMALVVGLAIVVGRMRYRRVPGLIIGIHATIAVCGVVVLAAYALVG